jgi:hypothetical protein
MTKLTEALGDKATIVRIRRTNQAAPTQVHETPVPQDTPEDEWNYEADEWWGS